MMFISVCGYWTIQYNFSTYLNLVQKEDLQTADEPKMKHSPSCWQNKVINIAVISHLVYSVSWCNASSAAFVLVSLHTMGMYSIALILVELMQLEKELD